jgi:uncharacterized membrane protein YgdD (TMEM256/DUF423 family)
MPSPRILIVLAAMLGAVGVGLGAFGAHALRASLEPAQLAIWQTGTSYLFWHVLAALLAASLSPGAPARAAASAFLLGTVSFSGTLFALALSAPRWFGAVTPVGGVLLILGWLLLAWAAWRR